MESNHLNKRQITHIASEASLIIGKSVQIKIAWIDFPEAGGRPDAPVLSNRPSGSLPASLQPSHSGQPSLRLIAINHEPLARVAKVWHGQARL